VGWEIIAQKLGLKHYLYLYLDLYLFLYRDQ
jgi:hypothetical protein